MSSRHIDLVVEIVFLLLAIGVLPWLRALAARAEPGKKKDAILFLEALAQTVVAEGEDEVRALKDPRRTDVGPWTADMAAKYQTRAIAALKRFGAKELGVLTAGVGGATPDEVARRIVEAQVELARARRPAATLGAALAPESGTDPAPSQHDTPAESPRAKRLTGEVPLPAPPLLPSTPEGGSPR